jgi:hypothetical protein
MGHDLFLLRDACQAKIDLPLKVMKQLVAVEMERQVEINKGRE